MAFTEPGARAAVKTHLDTVTDVGMTSDYRRAFTREADVREHLYSSALGKIRGAWISTARIGVASREFGSASGFAGVLTTYTFRIEVVQGIDDANASEKDFASHVDAIVHAFNRRGRIYADASHQEPMQAPTIGYLQLADMYLLHFAELSFELRGRTSP